MKQLAKIKKLQLREVWAKEAADFTPWLGENIGELGKVLGMDLELTSQEASVGDFSLDLLAKDLGTGHKVVVENQLTATDHDHLGKLLTYAAGFDASAVIWVAASIREEHRQTLEWLNQRTDRETDFFAVVVEVLQIDGSNPAANFRPIVFPNEWQKSKRSQASVASTKEEAYRAYFQAMIDELREKHKFTGARIGQPQNWYSFSIGISGVNLSAVFSNGDRARVQLYIDRGDFDENKALFDWLRARKDAIERDIGGPLDWERLDAKRASRVSADRPGKIESDETALAEIRKWQIERLLIFKKVLAPLLKAGISELNG
jgi:hypothetical protein